MRLTRRARAGAAALLAVAALGAGVAAGLAQTYSPSIAPSAVRVEDGLGRGLRHTLPALAVRNDSPQPIDIAMSATPHSAGVPGDEAMGWVEFEPARFTLEAGESRPVGVEVAVPDDAAFGPRSLWLRAMIPPPQRDGAVTVSVGAAVQSLLEFEVVEATAAMKAASSATDLSARRWAGFLALALLSGAAAYLLSARASRYRIRFRLSLERRDSAPSAPGGRTGAGATASGGPRGDDGDGRWDGGGA